MTAADEMRAALEKMTPGEWSHRGWGDGSTQMGMTNIFNDDAEVLLMECIPEHDAAGIVALRNLTPFLLAERDALAAEVARLRAALKRIADGDYPRPIGKVYRSDGVNSKHDKCIHDNWMYDDCAACAEDFARAALETNDE